MKKVLLMCAALIVAALPFALWYRVHAAERAWAQSFGPLDQWPARVHRRGNEEYDALRLWLERVLPSNDRSMMSDYIIAQRTSSSGMAELNGAIARYHAADIDELAGWVLKHDPPVTPVQADDFATPFPNVLYFMQLDHALIGPAMARAAGGDKATPQTLLEASWRMSDDLRHSNTLIQQLVAAAVFRDELVALRKIDVDAAVWLPRIRSVDCVKSVATAFQAEAWRLDASVRRNIYADESYLESERALKAGLGEQPSFKPRWLQLLRTPVRWLDLPSRLEGWRETLATIAVAPRSETIGGVLDDAYRRGASRWSFVPDADLNQYGPVSSAFTRAVATQAESELTEKVLLAREGRKKNGGRWPAMIDTSSKIANGHWVYQRTSRGATIRFSRPVTWTGMVSPTAPLECELR